MAKNAVNIEWTGSAAKALAEQEKLVKAQNKIIAQLQKEAAESKKTGDQALAYYRKAAGEAEKLGRVDAARLRQTIDQTQKQNEKLRQTAEAHQRISNESMKIGGHMKAVAVAGASALGVTASIGGAISTVVSGVKQWYDYMEKIGTASEQAALEMTTFALLQEKGTKAERVREVAAMPSGPGMSLGQKWNIVQAMQSSAGGDFARGKEMASALFEASWTGVPVEDLQKAVALSPGQRLQPWEAAYYPFRAGELSPFTPSDLIKAAPEMLHWEDKSMGWAAAVAMLQGGVDPGELGTAVKAGARGLFTDDKFWDRLGVGQAGGMERLAAMRDQGYDLPTKLISAGIDQRVATALVAMGNNLELLTETTARLEADKSPDYIARSLGATRAELPQLAYAAEAEKVRQLVEAYKAVGPESLPAQQRRLTRLERGAELTRQGLGRYVSDSGEAGWGTEAKIVISETAIDVFRAFAKAMTDHTGALKAFAGGGLPGLAMHPISGAGAVLAAEAVTSAQSVIVNPNPNPSGAY